MKAILCSVVTITALFLELCSSNDDRSLTRTPSDSSVLLDNTVTFECFTGDKSYPPTWSHQAVGSMTSKDVSLVFRQSDNGVIVTNMMADYAQRHKIVENRASGEYSLQITGVKTEDAGGYACTGRGGLGQKASAQLTVIESFPECASNVTEALGENDCNQDPDVVEFSCKFRVRSNSLPKILWVKANHPETVMASDTPVTDDTGVTSSKLLIRGDYFGLDETSFKCILVPEAGSPDDQRVSCVTPTIAVLKMNNMTESKTLIAPEEVECPALPNLHITKCTWIKRGDETVVSSKPLLNLHRADLTAGIYVCIGDCHIRGELCSVQLLSVMYQPAAESSSKNFGFFVIPIIGLFAGVAVIVLIVLVWNMIRKRKRTQQVWSTAKSDNSPTVPLTDSPTENSNPTAADRLIPDADRNPSGNHFGIDIPDAKLGGIGIRDRALLAEEKALARMRANAAAREGMEANRGFSANQANADFAEGVQADLKKND